MGVCEEERERERNRAQIYYTSYLSIKITTKKMRPESVYVCVGVTNSIN